MKQLISLMILPFLMISTTFAKDAAYPRQKIDLSGELLPNSPKSISFKDLKELQKPVTLKIFDPYNKNLETAFEGFYLIDLVKKYGKPDFKILRVGAIDGYKVDIPKNEIDSQKLFASYKDEKGFLTVDRMGPLRILAPVKGVVNKDLLLKIGVYWVWQVKTIEFVK
ncbi:MAG: hypothetical protein H7177_11635 [Rhizobacter sp.]|nr:hypothetical protein [Bacteriovorax sp.]